MQESQIIRDILSKQAGMLSLTKEQKENVRAAITTTSAASIFCSLQQLRPTAQAEKVWQEDQRQASARSNQ